MVNPPGPHSSFEDAIGSGSSQTSTGLAYWINYRKWPESKFLLGVPFYGRDFDDRQGAGISYADILEMYPEAWAYDQAANIYYNGMPTMSRKAQYIVDQRFSGIMIWELAQDHPTDSLSLLNAIHREFNP
ncbi:MAG: hypothetical protein KFF73_15910 [Cyclobacteriaceae bacterium]|nr:hypothetical protein [Cyclobacteriaceae bacterium]